MQTFHEQLQLETRDYWGSLDIFKAQRNSNISGSSDTNIKTPGRVSQRAVPSWRKRSQHDRTDLRSDHSGFSARVESKLFDKSERKEGDDIELLPMNNRIDPSAAKQNGDCDGRIPISAIYGVHKLSLQRSCAVSRNSYPIMLIHHSGNLVGRPRMVLVVDSSVPDRFSVHALLELMRFLLPHHFLTVVHLCAEAFCVLNERGPL